MTQYDHQKDFEGIARHLLDLHEVSMNPSTTSSSFPEHMYIVPTNACNLRCVHCYHSRRGEAFNKKLGFMDMKLFDSVLEQLKGRLQRLSITAHGEPLLHPNIVEMVAKASQAGFHVSVLTNAVLLTPEMGERLIDAGVKRMVMSHEGSTPELHEQVRVNSKYKTTEGNILEFIKLNSERGHPVFICLSMVESPYTAHDAEAYVQRYSQLPIDNIFVSKQMNFFGLFPLSPEQESELDANLKMPREKQPVCRVSWSNMLVNWDGDILACIIDYNSRESVVGNANIDTIQDVWSGERMRRFRQVQLDRDYSCFTEGLCRRCNTRFFPELNLLNMKEYIVNHLCRQAELLLTGNDPKPDAPEKIAALHRFMDDVKKLPD